MRNRGRRKVDGHYRPAVEVILKSQIGLPYTIIAEKLLTGTADRDPAVLENIGVGSKLERYGYVLLDQYAGKPVTVQIAHATQNVLHNSRREAKRRLIE